jgi:hypothetical protein
MEQSNPKATLSQNWKRLTNEAAELKIQIESGQGTSAMQKHCDQLLNQADEVWDWMQVDPARLKRAIESGEV